MGRTFWTVGDLARHFKVEVWHVRRLFERRFLPEPTRCGMYRMFTVEQLPQIEAALIAAGYLSAKRTEKATAAV
jgi:hypothetical protein